MKSLLVVLAMSIGLATAQAQAPRPPDRKVDPTELERTQWVATPDFPLVQASAPQAPQAAEPEAAPMTILVIVVNVPGQLQLPVAPQDPSPADGSEGPPNRWRGQLGDALLKLRNTGPPPLRAAATTNSPMPVDPGRR